MIVSRFNNRFFSISLSIVSWLQLWYNFLCHRKPAFHLLNLVIPVMSLSFLCIFVYALPPESGERMGLTLTAMVAFILLMTLVSERIPTTADNICYFGETFPFTSKRVGLQTPRSTIRLSQTTRSDQINCYRSGRTKSRHLATPTATDQIRPSRRIEP